MAKVEITFPATIRDELDLLIQAAENAARVRAGGGNVEARKRLDAERDVRRAHLLDRLGVKA